MLINNYLTIAFILNDKALFFLNLKNKRSQNLIQKLIQIKKKKGIVKVNLTKIERKKEKKMCEPT